MKKLLNWIFNGSKGEELILRDLMFKNQLSVLIILELFELNEE